MNIIYNEFHKYQTILSLFFSDLFIKISKKKVKVYFVTKGKLSIMIYHYKSTP